MYNILEMCNNWLWIQISNDESGIYSGIFRDGIMLKLGHGNERTIKTEFNITNELFINDEKFSL